MQALKGVVILMSVAIAVLMTLIVYGMYQKSKNPDFKFFDLSGGDTPAAAPASPQPDALPAPQDPARAFGDIALDLPPGARVVSATTSGTTLTLIVSLGASGPDQVWVVDIASGRVLGRIKAGQ